MQQILIIHHNLELGGIETSLIGLLEAIDYSKYSVDLLLYEQRGELLKSVPSQVQLLPEIPVLKALVVPIKDALKSGHFYVTTVRLAVRAQVFVKKIITSVDDSTYEIKQKYQYYGTMFQHPLLKEYDLAISFNDPHFILGKVNARVKIGWFHTDFSRIKNLTRLEKRMWDCCDYIACVSKDCQDAFIERHSYLKNRVITIENILSEKYVKKRAIDFDPMYENDDSRSIVLLSIGRFSTAKNFDNVPEICSLLRSRGLSIKWYIIGYGLDEYLIKHKIQEYGMEKYIILLGKKENPYPYIRCCDLYVQPSRFEGKCVAVREAQMLGKPVVITNYATSGSQIKDGIDGVIVPMDNEGCAEGIAKLISDKSQMIRLAETCRKGDYSNSQEISKIYRMAGTKD